LPMLQQGSGEIAKMGEELEMMGGLIKGDTVAALEQLGDKIAAITPQLQAVATEFVGVFGPVIGAVIDEISLKLKLLHGAMDIIMGLLEKMKAVADLIPGVNFSDGKATPAPAGAKPGAASSDPNAAKTAQNTATTNQKLDTMTAAIRMMGGGPPLAPAGIR
jgi:hypothetical protein